MGFRILICILGPIGFIQSIQNCDNQGGVCFVAGTKIKTKSGTKKIESIKKGDKVLSKDIKTEQLSYKEVLRTYINEAKTLLVIKTKGKVIKVTREHPFWTKRG